MPVDDESRFEAPLWVAFLARAVVEQGLRAPLVDSGRALRDFVATQLQAAQVAGAAAPELDPELEAGSLLALVDGLMVHSLVDPSRAPAALSILDYHLERIFLVRPRRR